MNTAHTLYNFLTDLHQEGLNLSQLRALARVADAPVSMTTIAESLGMTTPGITGVADVLEHKELVLRGLTPEDRRAIVLIITESGRALLDRFSRHLIPITQPAA